MYVIVQLLSSQTFDSTSHHHMLSGCQPAEINNSNDDYDEDHCLWYC